MRDDQDPPNAWAAYLIRATDRPGWSVARLSRESGIATSSLWRWIGGDARITIESVRQIAEALGDTRGAIAAVSELLAGDAASARTGRADAETEQYVAALLDTIRDPNTPRAVKEQLKRLLAGAAGLAESSSSEHRGRTSA